MNEAHANRTTTMKLPGWTHVHGAVWDHESGVRLHLLGMIRSADGSFTSANEWPNCRQVNRCVRIAGGNRKRGLMLWAESKP